jgi:hypothetical protein
MSKRKLTAHLKEYLALAKENRSEVHPNDPIAKIKIGLIRFFAMHKCRHSEETMLAT